MNEAETRAELIDPALKEASSVKRGGGSMMDTLQQLLAKGNEDEVVEFKEAKTKYETEKLGRYFSALSNEANLKGLSKAWLLFGVRDKDKAIVGSQYRSQRSELDKVKKEVADHTTGRVTFTEIHEVSTPQGRVVMFEIPPAPPGMPIFWKGHFYGRDGESLGALNLEEVERIRSQATVHDWSAQVVEGASFDDLDPVAVLKAREMYAEKNPKQKADLKSWDDEKFLSKAKLLIQGKVTRTALLLLGREESEHFLSPGSSKVTWLLTSESGERRDYKHFTCPLILTVEKVFKRIRNLKYRYMVKDTLFPEEVDQYDPYLIREALHNCIAHQDYTRGERISVVENEAGHLIFTNAGEFLPGSVEKVVETDVPPSKYRNPFLATAMVNLNMIDTIGSGIRKMFDIQRGKFFPLPDYDFAGGQIKVTITGKVIDLAYAQKLASMPTLSLAEIIALDKVAKKRPLRDEEIKELKTKKLIEGRKPNFHISGAVARATGDKSTYMKQRGIDNAFAEQQILDYLKQFSPAKRVDIEQMLLDRLPSVLDEKQKQDKCKNILQKLRRQGVVKVEGKLWSLIA